MARHQETIRHLRHIGDDTAEAIAHSNLGYAYMEIPAVRDLDAAESAYQRSLDLSDPQNTLNRSKCLQTISMVYQDRFEEARRQGGSEVALQLHAQAAVAQYRQALDLCPAITARGPLHNNLGLLYTALGQTERAREHYEQDVQICEQTSDRYGTGQTRVNLAIKYTRLI